MATPTWLELRKKIKAQVAAERERQNTSKRSLALALEAKPTTAAERALKAEVLRLQAVLDNLEINKRTVREWERLYKLPGPYEMR